jgi:hypothetical protein
LCLEDAEKQARPDRLHEEDELNSNPEYF